MRNYLKLGKARPGPVMERVGLLDRIDLGSEKLDSATLKPDQLEPVSTLVTNYVPTLREVLAKSRQILLSPWSGLILGLVLLVVTIAYQFNPTMYIKPGGGYDRPYLNLNEGGFGYAVRFDYDDGQSIFISPDASLKPALDTGPEVLRENYRWTHRRPILLLPGVGEVARLQLRAAASPAFPAGQQVALLLNGQPFTTFNLLPGLPKEYNFELGQYPNQGGNLAVEMRVRPVGPADTSVSPLATFNDGFKLYAVSLTPKSAGLIPPLGVTLSLMLAMLAFYFALAYVGLARLYAFGAAALLIGLSGLMLANSRLELSSFTVRMALLLSLAAIALPLLDLSLPRLFRSWQISLSRPVWLGLLALFLVGLLLRGTILYPQAVVIDAPAHLLEINKITQGQLWQQYTNRDLSKVPGQWNSAAVIPYSTISYFLLAPFALLPLDPAVSVNLLNILLDALRVFVIFTLAMALGTGARAALLGAGLYLFVPCTWLMNSWGNWPTTLSFWLAVLFLTLTLVLYRRLHLRRVWLGLTALLTLTMMVYSVTAVFMGLMLYIWAFGLFFVLGRSDKLARPNGKRIFAMATVAGMAAVVLYYWQFLADITTTLTSFDQSLSSGEGLGLGQRDFLPYLALYTDHVFISYGVGVLLTLALAVFGWAIFAPARLGNRAGALIDANEVQIPQLRSGRNLWFIGAWFAVFVIFGLAQWKVDMVDKQVWFTVPLICALAGVALRYLWQKLQPPTLRYAGQLALVALTGWLTYSTISLWIYRLFFKRH